MSIKSCMIIILSILLLSSLVAAQGYKLGVSVIPEEKIFRGGETIEIKATLYDDQNNLIDDEISVTIKDVRENILHETTISSNGNFQELKINENILPGQGTIILRYKETEIEESFFIAEDELAKFEIIDGKLIVTNIGNTKYTKKIYITIGDTTGTKSPNIGVGKSASYRLIAPEGNYNIRITDEITTISRGSVRLVGTGNVVGAIDESQSASEITGGISPDEDTDLTGFAKDSKFVNVFIIGIFGTMIPLTVERKLKKTKK